MPDLSPHAPFVSGDNLTVEGVPPIPLSLVNSLHHYTEFRAAAFADWHRVPCEMLIRTRFAATIQVHSVTFPGGDRRQRTFSPDAVGAASFQPATGGCFVFSKDTGGNEFSQNYRYDLEDGEITLLTDGHSKNSHGLWSNGGDRMVYSSTRRTRKDVDLYTICPTDPASDLLLTALEGGGWFVLDSSPDDTQLLVAEYVSISQIPPHKCWGLVPHSFAYAQSAG
jgi:hypothetical protein